VIWTLRLSVSSESQHVKVVPIDDVDDLKVVEDVQVPPKTVSIIENIAVSFDTPIIDETHMSSDSASDDVDEIVEPNTPTVPSKPFESPCAEYRFMVVPIDSSFRESPEFFTKIQQMVSSTSSFSGCLEFMSESNVPLSAGLDVCSHRHVISLILLSLGVMFKIPNALHLLVAHIDDITRSIIICNDNYKFAANIYSILQEFAFDNKVIVTSHPEAVSKLHAWRIDFDKSLKRGASITYELYTP